MNKNFNQASQSFPSRIEGLNFFSSDSNLQRFIERVDANFLKRQGARLEKFGDFAGGRLERQAIDSNLYHPPALESAVDSRIRPQKRIGRVRLNREYKDCQQELYRQELMTPCFDENSPESHLLPFIGQYLTGQSDISTGCPFAMSHPVALVIAKMSPDDIRSKYLPEMIRTDGYAAIGGTWATEKHSGSNVGGTQTEISEDKNGTLTLSGHNWFTSAVGFDRWITVKTARRSNAPEGNKGLSLVLVPSHLDDKWGIRQELQHSNHYNVTHLKDKVGTKGLATGEVELEGTVVYEIAPQGEGLKAMMTALGCSRVHNAMGAAGVLRRAYMESLAWAGNRTPFDNKLIEEPDIQKRILAIGVEWMAGTALAFEAARAFAETEQGTEIPEWTRIITALAKYKTGEQASWCTRKALELTGGNGYTLEYPVARQWLDGEVLNVWEGPEQIQAAELLRMLSKTKNASLLLDRLSDITSALPAGTMQNEKNHLKNLHQEITNILQKISKDDETAKRVSGQLLENFSTVMAYALLCQEAAWELEQYKDPVKQEVAAEFYTNNRLSQGIQPDHSRSDLHDRLAQNLSRPGKPEIPGIHSPDFFV